MKEIPALMNAILQPAKHIELRWKFLFPRLHLLHDFINDSLFHLFVAAQNFAQVRIKTNIFLLRELLKQCIHSHALSATPLQ